MRQHQGRESAVLVGAFDELLGHSRVGQIGRQQGDCCSARPALRSNGFNVIGARGKTNALFIAWKVGES
ncbi:hypothetical protein AA983_14395 [Dermacoccus sp. PE3]|nr:hypothetical protein AA983_14395 [Dermacoccus sp. PE3]